MSATTADPMSEKRKDYLSWDDYFMAVAFLSAMRSKDPSSQVGACIVNAEKKIVGIGYNGMPNGIDDDEISWARTGASPLDTKYPYVCHAELNAILNKNSASAAGCTLYVALFPCNECAKLIIQSGITEVKYVSDKYHDKIPFIASRRLLEMAKVKISQYVPSRRSVLIDFSCIGTVPSRTPRSGSAATTASTSNSATSAAAPISRAAPPSRTSHGVVSPPSAPAAAAAGMAVPQVVVQPATPETTPKRAHSKAAAPAAGAPASPVTPPPPRPATTTAPGAVASPSQAEGPAADATAQEEGACNLM